jgi:hypothetical protein
MKTLNVIRTTANELATNWGVPIGIVNSLEHLYIRCNAKGIVNWDVAPMYKHSELIKRGSYNVLDRKD